MYSRDTAPNKTWFDFFGGNINGKFSYSYD